MSLLCCCLSVASSGNLALQARASCKDKSASCVNDGDHATEWDGESRNIWYGWIDYPTLKMQWDTPRLANKIVLYDRPGLDNHTAACTIRFDDGSPVQVYAIPNGGTAKTVVFAPRRFKEMTVQVVDGIGEHIGLAELELYYSPEAKPEAAPRKTYTDPVSYVNPFIETGRGRWFFCRPGSMPFGMISAAPYTRNKNQGGGGYNYNSNTSDHMYIQRARRNGKALDSCWFYHRDFAKGGILELWLGPQPNKAWGTGKQSD